MGELWRTIGVFADLSRTLPNSSVFLLLFFLRRISPFPRIVSKHWSVNKLSGVLSSHIVELLRNLDLFCNFAIYPNCSVNRS